MRTPDSGGEDSDSTAARTSNSESALITPSPSTGNIGLEDDKFNETFVIVNERPVDDISLDFFYKPHTITLLIVSVLAVMYSAFVR